MQPPRSALAALRSTGVTAWTALMAFTYRKQSLAGVENRIRFCGYERRQCGPAARHAVRSISATMRWVMPRANGMARYAVTAATGQPTMNADSQRGTKSDRSPILKKVTTPLTTNTMIAVITI